MKNLGTKMAKIGDIVLPDDMPTRLLADHVKGLSESIETIGMLHTPIIRITDNKLLAGGDRVAACILAGIDQVQCLYYACTDEEIPDLEKAENYHRRHNEAAQREALVATYEKHLEEPEPEPERRPRGKPPTKKGTAIRKTAAEKGVSRSTVRKAVEALEPITMDTFGLPLKEEFQAEVIIIRKYLEEARTRIITAQGSLTKLHGSNVKVPEGPLERIRGMLKEVVQKMAAIYPQSMCPWCKGVEDVQEHCNACLGTGWVSKETALRAPSELLDHTNLAISVNGTIELLSPETESTPLDEGDPSDMF